MEIWKDIKGYEGLYQISNLGNVRSLDRYVTDNNKTQFIKGKNIKKWNNGHNYFVVSLCLNGKRKNYYVHRLVADNFIENKNNLEQINHIDGDKQNNVYTNLEWCTPKENMQHALINGLLKEDTFFKGKKVNQYSIEGKFIKQFNSTLEAKNILGVNDSSIQNCCKGRHKTAGGYVWEYV